MWNCESVKLYNGTYVQYQSNYGNDIIFEIIKQTYPYAPSPILWRPYHMVSIIFLLFLHSIVSAQSFHSNTGPNTTARCPTVKKAYLITLEASHFFNTTANFFAIKEAN